MKKINKSLKISLRKFSIEIKTVDNISVNIDKIRFCLNEKGIYAYDL